MKATVHTQRSFTPALLAAGLGTVAAGAGWLAPRAVELDTRSVLALCLAMLSAVACFLPLRRVDLGLFLAAAVGLIVFTAIRHADQWQRGDAHLFYDTAIARVALPEWLLLGAVVAGLLCTSPRDWMRWGATPLLLGGLMAYGLLIGVAEGCSATEALRDARKLGAAILVHCALVLVLRSPRRVNLFMTALAIAATVAALKLIVLWLNGVGFQYKGFLRGSVDVGDFLILGTMICVATARLRCGVGSRLASCAWIGLASMALLASGSRAAWCAVPVGVVLVFLMPLQTGSRGRQLTTVFILLLGAATPFLFSNQAESALDRISSLQNPTHDSSVSYRWTEVQGTAAEIAESPLTGMGFGVGFDPSPSLVDRRTKSQQMVHNLPLWVGVKAGLPGILLFVLVLGLTFRSLLRALRTVPPGKVFLVIAVLGALPIFLSIGTVGAMLNQFRVACIFGFLTGMAVVLERWREPGPEART